MDPFGNTEEESFLRSGFTSDDEEEEIPLGSSFSQILRGDDVLFSGLPSQESTLNSNENPLRYSKDTLTFSNFINNTLIENLCERNSPSIRLDEDDDEFRTIDTKALQLSF